MDINQEASQVSELCVIEEVVTFFAAYLYIFFRIRRPSSVKQVVSFKKALRSDVFQLLICSRTLKKYHLLLFNFFHVFLLLVKYSVKSTFAMT